jgi:hypothetical protein
MITTSKNNSFLCAREICDNEILHCMECKERAEGKVHPFKRQLRDLWMGIRLFLGTDRWNNAITQQRGYSHYTMKQEELEKRWRHQQDRPSK